MHISVHGEKNSWSGRSPLSCLACGFFGTLGNIRHMWQNLRYLHMSADSSQSGGAYDLASPHDSNASSSGTPCGLAIFSQYRTRLQPVLRHEVLSPAHTDVLPKLSTGSILPNTNGLFHAAISLNTVVLHHLRMGFHECELCDWPPHRATASMRCAFQGGLHQLQVYFMNGRVRGVRARALRQVHSLNVGQ